MKSYYKGTLLTPCAQDANNQIVPIAFCICESESKATWRWFVSKVGSCIQYRSDMYILSDRHKGILIVVRKIFPHAGHGFCVEHLRHNMTSKFRGSAKDLGWKFKAAYSASTVKRKCRRFVVNLNSRICICGQFQLDQFVCLHDVAAIGSRPRLSCYNYISSYYTREQLLATWSGIMHPIGDPEDWVIPSDVSSTICKPPTYLKRPPGRPKKSRIPSIGEHVRSKRRKCSRCKIFGHNKKTCRNALPVDTN
ncbi:unnamed protein product [Cuscuta europaea]|uniref:SWIM-type domain-containing protein n=1 Tax=Cuscuta europaea TaxID=41803 RepID=A0A9P1E1T1_CUSEU|nr:unnamed protein product [Cuscuta europaea]